MKKWSNIVFAVVLAFVSITAVVNANGEEALGDHTVSITTGSGVASAGICIEQHPASVDLEAPSDVTTTQTLLNRSGATGDDWYTLHGDNSFNSTHP